MQQIVEQLTSLGSTPEQVADTLRAANVRGLRDSTSFLNPIVRFLNRSLNIGGRLEIGASGTVLRLQLSGQVRAVPLPDAVQAFLAAFHRSEYPDLEEAHG